MSKPHEEYYRAEVVGVRRLTPNMMRIRFGGDDLRRFRTSGFGDERICVFFPRPGDRHTPEPVYVDGRLDYSDGPGRPPSRSYTVRRWDAENAELEIDFVVHEGGVAAGWALSAQLGDGVGLSATDGWYAPPEGTQWQLLLADMTALPALGRIIEELPAGTRAHAIVEVIFPDDAQTFETAGDVTVEWIHGTGHGHAPSALLDALKAYDFPDGPGYIWLAAEASISRDVRKYVRRELGWPIERFEIIGYWRVRKEEWLARWREKEAELEAVYTQAQADGLRGPELREHYLEALEKAGL
ncbi:siderophore-interacting protein [Microlunatus ginsengisoli]|uniref:Siderophore-interacting protein n=1 Tax=Microlunatus ginsengisoli TaxID=363863 RepID=A0ABP6ZCG9_9ACTN